MHSVCIYVIIKSKIKEYICIMLLCTTHINAQNYLQTSLCLFQCSLSYSTNQKRCHKYMNRKEITQKS